MKETAIYIHIPFCDHKCIYCDFYSIITHDSVGQYLSALKKEIECYSQKMSGGRKIISIYFGGGTPSLMHPEYIGEIISHVKSMFEVNTEAEITLETNPGTVDIQKLAGFKQNGINRISIGIQSFDATDLKFLTRIHNAEIAIQTVYSAQQIGFENISVDLIFNLPGQSREKWLHNLEQAVRLPIKHISAYSLILEPGTILNKMVLDCKVKMQDSDHDADLYEFTIDFLINHNFVQYEVSNFARPGFECIHNNAYWWYKDYLGFGTSAHSFADRRRWWNYSSTKFYIDAITKYGNACIGEELLSSDQILEEYVMLAFRSKGLDTRKLKIRFGDSWLIRNKELIEELIDKKFIIADNDLLYLSPNGYALCDEIISKFQ